MATVADGANIVVAHAPVGHGKTTLLRDFHDSTTGSVWVSLTPSDTSRSDFWAALIDGAELLGRLDAARASELRAKVLDPDGAVRAVAALFTDLPGLVFVVDRFEHVTLGREALWSDLEDLAQMQPRTKIAVSTRSLVGLGERLTFSPLFTLIDADALALSVDEVADLARDGGPEPTRSEIIRITEETGGHPLAVRAALLEYATHAPAPWSGVVHREVVRELDKAGLLDIASAVLPAPFFDIHLAQVLTGWPTTRVAHDVERLAAHGFGSWESPGSGESVFRLIAAVRDALLPHVRLTGAEQDRAATIAQWLEDRGHSLDALGCAVSAELYSTATGILRRRALEGIGPGRFIELEPLLRSVPHDVLAQHPYMSMARGLGLMTSPTTRSVAEAYLVPMAEAPPVDLPHGHDGEQLVEVTAHSVALRLLNRVNPAGAAANRGKELLDRIGAGGQARHGSTTALACQLAESLVAAGQLAEASSLLAAQLATQTNETDRRLAAAYGALWAALDGRLDEARSLVLISRSDATHDSRTTTQPHLVARAALLLDDFDFAGALAVLEGDDDPHMRLRPYAEWIDITARLGLGAQVSDLRDVMDDVGAGLGAAAIANTAAIGWLAAGNRTRASDLIDAASDFPGQIGPALVLREMIGPTPADTLRMVSVLRNASGHTMRSRASLETMGAAAALRAGVPRLAESMLSRAAEMFVDYGVRAHVAHLPHADLLALRQLAEADESGQAQRYLSSSPPTPWAEPPVQVTLTPRELQVLHALVTHSSRTDMATALYVSHNTVKTQLRSVYRKLGVSGRTEAIARAIELDLLTDGGDHHL